MPTGGRVNVLAWVAFALVLVLSLTTPATGEDDPAQVLRVAYPEEPTTWHPARDDAPPSVDLAHLWGVPLYRYDHHGQLRPVLAASARIDPGGQDGPWTVEIGLRDGRWSDGEPIVADDVVATVEVLRGEPWGTEFAGLRAVEAIDDRVVRLEFGSPEPRWPHLLAGPRSVLPAHVLADGGLDAFGGGVPVSGGPFRLVEHEPALRAVFERHDDGPLGPPGLDRIEVYFTPSYETALGLLDRRRVDAALGYLAPNPVGRALRVDDVDADAPIGGTWTTLTFSSDGALGGSEHDRRGVRDVVSVAAIADGLLGRDAEVMTSPIPGVAGPWSVDRAAGVSLDQQELTVLVRGAQEVAGVTGRMLQHHIGQAGGQVELVRLALDEQVGRTADAEFTVRRDGPRPALIGRLPGDAGSDVLEVVASGDRAARTDDEVGQAALGALHDAAWERPLFRAGVGQAWRTGLEGVRASSWPGLALWEVERWRWGPDGPPEQEPSLRGTTR